MHENLLYTLFFSCFLVISSFSVEPNYSIYMDLCQETSCFRLASGKKQIIYILTEHIGDNFGRYPKILNAIFVNLTVEIRISIEKDKSEPVSNWEKVRIIFACVATSHWSITSSIKVYGTLFHYPYQKYQLVNITN